jgi:regulator of nonsense transcripts 2
MDELKSVNLSKFVSEAVSYICEAKLRSADIQAAVQVICNNSSLHFM